MLAPVFRTLEGLAPYEETVTAMAAHAAAIRNGGAGEEVWLLEHHSVLTGGTPPRPVWCTGMPPGFTRSSGLDEVPPVSTE